MIVEKLNIDGLEFNQTDNEMSWRLVYDDKKVIQLFQSGGYTMSKHNIFLANSKEACLTEIYRLNLIYEAPEAPETPWFNYKPWEMFPKFWFKFILVLSSLTSRIALVNWFFLVSRLYCLYKLLFPSNNENTPVPVSLTALPKIP